MCKTIITTEAARAVVIDALEGRNRDKVRTDLTGALIILKIDPNQFARIRFELNKVTGKRPKAEVPHGDHEHWH